MKIAIDAQTLISVHLQTCILIGRKKIFAFFAVTFVTQDTNVQPRTLSVGNAEKGHYSKVCRSALYSGTSAAVELASITGFENNIISATSPSTLSKAITKVLLNGKIINALIDTGSTESFIRDDLVKELELKRHPRHGRVSMAATTLSTCTPITGACMVDFTLLGRKYNDVYLSILPCLCSDIIIGHDFMRKHEEVTVKFGGNEKPLSICRLTTLNRTSPPLFANLKLPYKPIATKSRQHSFTDRQFITGEVNKLLDEKIIEPSCSPWRAQVLVTTSEHHKKRMVIDYSQTINKYTQLDAYPLPRIDNLVNNVSQYSIFSTIDLTSAYHQVAGYGQL